MVMRLGPQSVPHRLDARLESSRNPRFYSCQRAALNEPQPIDLLTNVQSHPTDAAAVIKEVRLYTFYRIWF